MKKKERKKEMARQPMITRTITTTNVTFMCVNTETKEVTETVITLPRIYKDEKAITRFIEKHNIEIGENLKPVTILKTETVKALYGMFEEEFVKVAKKMDSRFENLNTIEDDETEPEVAPTPAEAPKKKNGSKNK